MSRIEILIDTVDKLYGFNLGKALALKDALFSVFYTDMTLGKAAGNTESGPRYKTFTHRLLLTDKIVSAEGARKKGWPLVFLSHDPSENLGCPNVFIYGGLEEIAEKIYKTLEAEKGFKIKRFSLKRSRLLCVLSGAGGVGCSTLAIGLGKELALNFGAKVLYISLENIPSTSVYFQDMGGKASINEYIYHLFKYEKTKEPEKPEAEARVNPCLDAYLIGDFQGLKAFRPAVNDNQVLSLSKEEIGLFLNKLAMDGGFDYIILDMDGEMPSLSEDFLNACHKLLLIDDARPLSLHKNRKWLEKWRPDFEKTIYVSNKWDRSLADYEDENFHVLGLEKKDYEGKRFFIEKDPDLLSDISINTKFGIGVRRLADELTRDI